MRARAAAHAEIVHVERLRFSSELGDLVATEEKRIEGGGERAIVRTGLVTEALENRLGLARPVRHRQGRHVTGHGGANLAEERPEIVASMRTKMLEALRPVPSAAP